jgi:competence protein ComEA
MRRKHLLDFFKFSFRERMSFISLCLVMVAILAMNFWMHYYDPPLPDGMIQWVDHNAGVDKPDLDSSGYSFAEFDPNTVKETELLAYGLSEKAVRNLLKFRQAGGRFRSPEDILKLYSWNETEKQLALPFVRIEVPEISTDANPGETYFEYTQTEPFVFDPNTCAIEDWQRLGLSKTASIAAVNYTKAGGEFRKPEDIRKIYGLDEDLADRLIPYAMPPSADWDSAKLEEGKTEESEQDNLSDPLPLVSTASIPINSCDAEALITCGIDKGMAWKVVNYRDKLGGFYSLAQLSDVWGINDTVVDMLTQCCYLNEIPILKIRINDAGFSELANHPYLSDRFARAIIQYRDSTGSLRNVDELARVYRMSPEFLKKLKHYLTL